MGPRGRTWHRERRQRDSDSDGHLLPNQDQEEDAILHRQPDPPYSPHLLPLYPGLLFAR